MRDKYAGKFQGFGLKVLFGEEILQNTRPDTIFGLYGPHAEVPHDT
jgi:hypothetical protein